MARFNPTGNPQPIRINNFLGLNESVGETQIKLGEAVSMENFRITKNYKAQKRDGYTTFIDYGNSFPVYMWDGVLDGDHVLISTNNGNVYSYDWLTQTNTLVGTLTSTEYVEFFWYDGYLYFLNGVDYKRYDGTTLEDVPPYVPTVVIETPPTGGGTVFEQLNVLTGQRKQEFIGQTSVAEYQLVNTNIDSVDLVTNDGVTVNSADYTVDLVNGTITFDTPPADDSLVIVTYTKNDNDPNIVKKNKHHILFGPGNSTNVFLWGNADKKNRRIRSYILDPTYYPANFFTDVGSEEFAITDIVQQYNRQIVFKEDRTYYSFAEQISYVDGTYTWEYPVFDLNQKVGNVAPAQVRLIENSPVSLKSNNMWLWTNTDTEDERNANIISSKIKLSLLDFDLSNAVTYDFQRMREYWLCVGSEVFIWNYENDSFYKFTNIPAVQFLSIDEKLYFSTNGTIEEFSNLFFNDNGAPINCSYELGFNDFGEPNMLKNTRKFWVTVKPESKTGLRMLWQTNNKAITDDKAIEISYRLSTFEDMDFGDFSFSTNRNPEPYRRKIRAKKYAYIKFIFTNENINESLTLLGLHVEAETNGEVK